MYATSFNGGDKHLAHFHKLDEMKDCSIEKFQLSNYFGYGMIVCQNTLIDI